MSLDRLPVWAWPALAAVAALLVLLAALRLRRRWRQGRADLEEARAQARAWEMDREVSLGPVTPAPPAEPEPRDL